jgi:hypothetical protein
MHISDADMARIATPDCPGAREAYLGDRRFMEQMAKMGQDAQRQQGRRVLVAVGYRLEAARSGEIRRELLALTYIRLAELSAINQIARFCF